jgi:hypothetical protein
MNHLSELNQDLEQVPKDHVGRDRANTIGNANTNVLNVSFNSFQK